MMRMIFKKTLLDIVIIVFEGMEDSKIEFTKLGIQKINQGTGKGNWKRNSCYKKSWMMLLYDIYKVD